VTRFAALVLAAAALAACGSRDARLRLATTTSVENSGLLSAILPAFQQESGIEVDVLAVGTGRAIQLMRRGDADLAITHDPEAESALLMDVPSADYRKIMFNDFLIVGPEDDPAGVRGAPDARSAMRAVASSSALFASRGDESGTYAREQQLWTAAGVRPAAERLIETGQGMAPTLRIASERKAYTLTDRATYMQLAKAVVLRSLFEGDAALLNTYAAIILPSSPRRENARRFVAWIGEGAGRDGIAAFGAGPSTALGAGPSTALGAGPSTALGAGGPFTVWPRGRPSGRPQDLPR
jgi:tungstate transport system substrate-binding protein